MVPNTGQVLGGVPRINQRNHMTDALHTMLEFLLELRERYLLRLLDSVLVDAKAAHPVTGQHVLETHV